MANGKDAYWFHHDCNARHDPRIVALKLRYGLAGECIFWHLVEMLRESSEYRLAFDEATLATIAYEGMTTPDEARAIVEHCVNLGLLQSGEDHFWSPSLIRRMERWEETKHGRSTHAKRAATARWDTPHAQPMPEQCPSNARAMPEHAQRCPTMPSEERRGEESRVEEIRGDEIREEGESDADAPPPSPTRTKPRAKIQHPTLSVPMNETRYTTLCDRHGKPAVDDYIERVKDWAASKVPPKRVADYASAAANWLKRDKIGPRVGYEASAQVRAPTKCPHCGEKVRDLHTEAVCQGCGAEWERVGSEWRETSGAGKR